MPPTGAKGPNLGAGDVHYAAEAMTGFFKRNDGDFITACSDKSLTRVWTSEPFSWSLTRLMHRLPEDVRSERAMQVAALDHIATSARRRHPLRKTMLVCRPDLSARAKEKAPPDYHRRGLFLSVVRVPLASRAASDW
ncbi:hypothetical protein GCM10010990_35940 [Croceicoccus mobilis]|uniref:Uncharacterized protein n=1 Tax=Croceicoccus mobilis TaxID=1703339 RepID=A0A916ZAB6_9SPHN|nr:hypothetical protein GCM10010990_35940 [Croceicoccus mobilis]